MKHQLRERFGALTVAAKWLKTKEILSFTRTKSESECLHQINLMNFWREEVDHMRTFFSFLTSSEVFVEACERNDKRVNVKTRDSFM